MTRRSLIAITLAAAACAPEPTLTYSLAVSGFDDRQQEIIHQSVDQWGEAGWLRVDESEAPDRHVRIQGAWLLESGLRGRSLGSRVLIDYRLDNDCLRLTAAHELGHSLARRSDHLEGRRGVMRAAPPCGAWPIADEDVEWALEAP